MKKLHILAMAERFSPLDFLYQDKRPGIYLDWNSFWGRFSPEEGKIKNIQHMFDRLQDEFKVQIRISDKADGQTYILESFNGRFASAVLSIKDFDRFLQNIEKISSPLGLDVEKLVWLSQNSHQSLFINASVWDFEHPEDYLERLMYELKDTTFEDLSEGKPLGSDDDLGTLFVKSNIISDAAAESPYELAYSRTGAGQKPGNDTALATVQYGRVSPTEAVIYAIQMPHVEKKSRSNIPKIKEAFEIQKKNFRKLFFDSRLKELLKLAGIKGDFNLPSGILAVREELFQYFLVQHPEVQSTEEFRQELAFDHWLRSKIFDAEDQIFTRLVSFAEQCDGIDEVERSFQQREQNIDAMGKFFRMKGKAVEDPRIKDVYHGALVPFLLSLKLLSERGVTDITIPTFFPLRQKIKSPEIDERLFKQKLFLALRAEYEMDGGVEIVPTSPEDGCIRLRLHPPLRSKRPEFGKVLDQMDQAA